MLAGFGSTRNIHVAAFGSTGRRSFVLNRMDASDFIIGARCCLNHRLSMYLAFSATMASTRFLKSLTSVGVAMTNRQDARLATDCEINMKRCALLFFVLLSAGVKAESAPSATVAQLYKDFAWEVVFDDQADLVTLIDQPRPILEKYLTPQLATLWLADRSCVETSGEMCRMSFDPLWNSQDPVATRLKITSGSKPNLVDVSYQSPGSEQTVSLRFQLIKLASGWRIDDIRYDAQTTLREILETPL